MSTIQVYDPPMCCSTRLCGNDIDPGLVSLAAAFKQSMNDAPLTKHLETGAAIRGVVLGGFGVLSSKRTNLDSAPGCGPACGCH